MQRLNDVRSVEDFQEDQMSLKWVQHVSRRSVEVGRIYDDFNGYLLLYIDLYAVCCFNMFTCHDFFQA